MSLMVKLNQFRILKSKSEKYARLEFRGQSKFTDVLSDSHELIDVNQVFQWTVNAGEAVVSGDTLELQLVMRNRWGHNNVVGVYTLGMHVVVAEGYIHITDSLIDDKNRYVQAYVNMEVFYIAPPGAPIPSGVRRRCGMQAEDAESASSGEAAPAPAQASRARAAPSSAPASAHTSRHNSAQSSDLDSEGEDNLERIGRHIANYERSVSGTRRRSLSAGSELPPPPPQAAGAAGDGAGEAVAAAFRAKRPSKGFLKRAFSMGETEQALPGERKRRSTMRTVRNLMRLGRQRASADEERRGLVGARVGTARDADAPAPPGVEPAAGDADADGDGGETDSAAPREQRPTSAEQKAKPKRAKCGAPSVAVGGYGAALLKAADFQVCVSVIEARQLAGLNMDPVVGVQVGDARKYTSVKESTNCPYYNEYFVFDFHMPPIMLFDKIIVISVLQSRNILRPNKLLGTFKLDVATVWGQPDRQFYHKWAVLTDPDDFGGDIKGYVKCDISIIGKGDTVKIPPKSEKDEDDIEANLLLPDGVPVERQRARFVVKVYRADGLPKMNYSLLANVKRALTGEARDLVDPQVLVSFAGMTGATSVKKGCYAPVWNEQIVFTEMFPPLCQRIKLQLRDNDPVRPTVIGTHFIDLNTISDDGEKGHNIGFLPTFGPAFVNLYGSTRDYSLINQQANLNAGMGEGVSYRARLLVAIRTEIIDNMEPHASEVEVEPAAPIHEASYGQPEEFFLFASLFECNMIDKKLTEKPISFELSMGNAGNTLDGNNESYKRSGDPNHEELEIVTVETSYWQSTVRQCHAHSTDNTYFYLPCFESKPCMQVRAVWPDNSRRMYNSNIIGRIVDVFEEGLTEVQASLEGGAKAAGAMGAMGALRGALEAASAACLEYAVLMPTCSVTGNTKLDRERTKMCQRDIEQIAQLTRTLKALVTKHSLKDRLKTAYSHLNRLKELCEDPQHSLPDVFLWMISNGKRLAYARVPARHLIYSDFPNERGILCGKMQTLFLKWPGKKAEGPSGWAIPGKVYIYMWLGTLNNKKHFIDGLPQGYEISVELRNADNPSFNAPKSIFYAEKHNFQLRAYIYQARSLIGSDASGLSDPFARVICGESSATTQVIDETLSPTWDELLVLNEILLYSTIDQIKSDPPSIVIEVFDQDKVGKSEFIGRTTAKPNVKAFEDPYERPNFPPSLEWYELIRGGENAGELLAAFELLEMPGFNDNFILPELPSPRTPSDKSLADDTKGPILPVPRGIRPTLSTYRIEVLFWGLRDLKRIHLLTVDQPRVDIECAGNTISSALIQNTKRNPNFTSPVKFVDVELPDQELYRPPLTIRVIDCRSFGRVTLVGTHTINSIHKYMYTPMSKREKDAEDRNKSVIQLQHLDFKRNIFGDPNADSSSLEHIPLLPRGNHASTSYGSGSQGQPRIRYIPKIKDRKNRKESKIVEDDERSKDWWTKYFASIEYMIEQEKQAKQDRMICLKPQAGNQQISPHNDAQSRVMSPRGKRDKTPQKAKPNQSTPKKMEIPISSLVTIYPHELEATPEYEEFKEWLQSFDLYRGKKTGYESDDENRVVGVFKGAVKVYKWPIPKGIDDHTIMGFDPNYGFFQGLPSNEPIHVLVRVYIVKATDLHPMDLNGKADPYILLHLGSKRISDKENYVSKQLNPVFGKCFEVEASFPQDSMLTIQVLDWDLFGSDDLIGETKIDLENRFYSRHRATCGLPRKYEESGYNRWRDSMKPTQILAKLCKDGKVESPVFTFGKVKIGRTIFHMPMVNDNGQEMCNLSEEDKALIALRQWHEFPRIGTHLVTEHVETRPLYNPNKPGIEQGRLEMWVDMFPMDMPLPGAPLDISPRKPQHFELRVIVWNTDDVVLEDDEFFTGEKMSDIYVKGWVKGPEDCQSTDIHYRSLTGEGNFNWRFVYPFEYLEAEEKIVISRKESMFSWDQSECKIPARLELQVWDADHFSADDFLGAMTLDLNRFPRGAKSSQLCTLNMLRNDGTVPMVNIFKQKRVKGWWPFYIKREAEQMVLTGKMEAEIHLLTREEADKVPAGLGRNEPDPLEKPNRPDASFMWFLNPLKSVRYIVWHNYKWTIIKSLIILGLAVLLLLFFYAIPGYSVKKILGA